jgi:hypothetical protein
MLLCECERGAILRAISDSLESDRTTLLTSLVPPVGPVRSLSRLRTG